MLPDVLGWVLDGIVWSGDKIGMGRKGRRGLGCWPRNAERVNIRSVNSHHHSFLAVGAGGLGAVDPDGVCVVYCHSECALCDQKQIKVSSLIWFEWLS